MTQIRSKEIRMVPLDEIKLNPKNRNKHSKDQIARLAQIIEYQGFRQPLMISNQSGLLVAGHGRYAAAKKLKLKEVPVIFQDFDSMEQEIAAGVSDNSIALWAELDLEGINIDLADLGPDFNIDLLGIQNFSIDAADKEGLTDPDDVPETPKESPVCRGELFRLGNHRLLCGDSTSITDVERLMNGDNCDITFTSPPYNAAKNGHLNNSSVSGFENKYKSHSDDMSDDDYLNLLLGFTNICLLKTKYTFVNIQLLAHNRGPLFKYQEKFQSLIKDIFIWNKKQCPPNIVKGAFNTKWEYVFCFSEDNKTRGFPCDWRGQHPNVIETESNSANEFAEHHKAGFPVSFPIWFLEKFEFAKNVYEPFTGTGTTLIACEKTDRKCYGMEIDPHYCSVILDRWAAFTGKDPVRLNDDGTETPWSEIKATLKPSILA